MMDRIRPKKALGQNFLVDGNVITNIIKAACVKPEDRILEIGPGRGALTRRLAEKAARVVAVELDRELVEFLDRDLGQGNNVQVVSGDILRTDLPGLLGHDQAGSWKVVANLPYNISSQVLFKFLENRNLFSDLVLMLQKEVGERLLAAPSSKEYGSLTVLCRLYFDLERVLLVKPGSFRPVPKVDSLVLRFRTLTNPRIDVGDEELFRKVVKASFANRRKTLWNCLKSSNLTAGEDALEEVFVMAAIDRNRRGETLSLDEFARLCRTMERQNRI